jgi:hypothetical protein
MQVNRAIVGQVTKVMQGACKNLVAVGHVATGRTWLSLAFTRTTLNFRVW